jgi:alkyl sulfatase BDS1-like metallo-beta-lactamase superfamily hydrolase
MYIKTFITNLNKATFLAPILMNRSIIVEFRSTDKDRYFLELSSTGAKQLASPPKRIDFVMQGGDKDLEEVLLNKVSLKQLISFGKLTITGSYRDFLKLEALIKLA